MAYYKADLEIRPGDRVLYGTTLPGLSGGSCRRIEKVVVRVDEGADRVYFEDGTSFHHADDPNMIIDLVDARGSKVLIP